MNKLKENEKERTKGRVRENPHQQQPRARARLYGIDVDMARRLLAKLRERPIPPEECCWFAGKAGK